MEVDDDAFGTLSARFLDWLTQNGTTISPKIQLADLRGQLAGRGVIARVDIAEDEELFSIPRSSILTVETSTLPANLKQQLNDPWLSLILAMVYEFQQGPSSRWKAYFDVLPTEFHTLMYWTDTELSALSGSAILSKIGKTTANNTFTTQLLPIIRANTTAFHSSDLSDPAILSLCHRMGSTIMAYAFDLEPTSSSSSANNNHLPTANGRHNESEEGEEEEWEEDSDTLLPKGMVPLADMLNADADRNNAKLFYADNTVVMKALRPIVAGEEIFNDYGPLPRADVLRRYGYVTDHYAVYDVVEIELELVKDVAAELFNKHNIPARLEYLESCGLVDDGYDIARAESEEGQFSDELKALVNCLTLPAEEFEKLRRKGKEPKPDLSEEAKRLLCAVVVRRRGMYPDQRKVVPDHLDSRSRRRHNMARQVIEGEKEVLRTAAETLGGTTNGSKKRTADDFDDNMTNLQNTKKHHGHRAG